MRKLGEILAIRGTSTVKVGKEVKKCPKCGSNNLIGRAMVKGMAFINLDTMKTDELCDDFEICDVDNLRYECWDCGREWE